jgi:hypothetical protein
MQARCALLRVIETSGLMIPGSMRLTIPRRPRMMNESGPTWKRKGVRDEMVYPIRLHAF